MQRNILKFTDDGEITLDGFDKIENKQQITIKILGNRKVIIALDTPNQILECHNIITLENHKCFAPGLVTKLVDAGIEKNTCFFFATDAYYISK